MVCAGICSFFSLQGRKDKLKEMYHDLKTRNEFEVGETLVGNITSVFQKRQDHTRLPVERHRKGHNPIAGIMIFLTLSDVVLECSLQVQVHH